MGSQPIRPLLCQATLSLIYAEALRGVNFETPSYLQVRLRLCQQYLDVPIVNNNAQCRKARLIPVKKTTRKVRDYNSDLTHRNFLSKTCAKSDQLFGNRRG